MDNFIYKLSIMEHHYPKVANWLSYEDTGEYKDDDIECNVYEMYFLTWDEVVKKIEQLTQGCYQYWGNIFEDHKGNDFEDLEYHNGHSKWDKEIHIEWSRLYMEDTLIECMKKKLREMNSL